MLRLGQQLLRRARGARPQIRTTKISLPASPTPLHFDEIEHSEPAEHQFSVDLPDAGNDGLQTGLVHNRQQSISYMDPMIMQTKINSMKLEPENILLSSSSDIVELNLKAKHLKLATLFTKLSPEALEKRELFCEDTNIVPPSVEFPNNSHSLAVFKHVDRTKNGLPMSIVFDGINQSTDLELARHIRQSRHCSQFYIPGGDIAETRTRLYESLPKELFSNTVQVRESFQLEDLENEILAQPASLVLFLDALSSSSTEEIYRFNLKRVSPSPRHIYIFVSPNGEFSQQILELRDRFQKNKLFDPYHKRHRLRHLTLDVCDLTPQIEQDVKERVASFQNADQYPGVIRRNAPPGTPILSSTLANSMITHLTLQLGH